MVDFYFQLHPVIQATLKGLAVILVIFPLGGICSMAERKVSAWIQGRPGPNRAIVPWIAWIPFVGTFLQRLGLFHVMADGGKMLEGLWLKIDEGHAIAEGLLDPDADALVKHRIKGAVGDAGEPPLVIGRACRMHAAAP